MTNLVYSTRSRAKGNSIGSVTRATSPYVRMQDAYERHEVILKGIIGRRRASAVPRKHGIQNALELRGHLTEGVLVLARNRKDRVFLSPDDAIPEYNFISNL